MSQSGKSEDFKKAREYAYRLFKFRLRSISEFRGRLSKRGFGEDVISGLVDDFKRRGLLDDIKFAKAWVTDRARLKPMGRLRIRMELEAKGIDRECIERVFDETAPEADEYEIAKTLAQRRTRHSGRLDRLTLQRRLLGFLKRRGFSYDVVNKVVKEVTKDEGRCNP